MRRLGVLALDPRLSRVRGTPSGGLEQVHDGSDLPPARERRNLAPAGAADIVGMHA